MTLDKENSAHHKGKYIAIEGIDGTGKSTVKHSIEEALVQAGFDIITVQEPTANDIGRLIRKRKKMLETQTNPSKKSPIDKLTEARIDALLFAADRLELHRQVIEPALTLGKIVLSDRSLYSSVAYQTCQGAQLEWVLKVNEHALKPDVVFLLDCPVELALKRLQGVKHRETFENFELLTCVREQYLKMCKNQKNWFMIDATKDETSVREEILAILQVIIPLNR